MEPGETILGFDFGNHLWVVLSKEDANGDVVLANLTTHGRLAICGTECVVLTSQDHSYVTRESCVYYRGAVLNPVRPLQEQKDAGTLRQHDRCSPALLRQIQEGALQSRFTPPAMKAAIRASLPQA